MESLMRIKNFYNQYGDREWDRLGRSAYDIINYILHMDFLLESFEPEMQVLDAGCGPGRFSIELAKLKGRLTLLDISEKQLEIAREKLDASGLLERVDKFHTGNLGQMTEIPDNTYDITLCYGAPLNYLYDNYKEGLQELYRVTKPGGQIIMSVNSRMGIINALIANSQFDIVDFLGRPDYWKVDEVVVNGDLMEHPEVEHPPRHFFNAEELKSICQTIGFKAIEMASSPCLSSGQRERTELIYEDHQAWETLVDLELKTYKRSTTLDIGEFILLKGTK